MSEPADKGCENRMIFRPKNEGILIFDQSPISGYRLKVLRGLGVTTSCRAEREREQK